MRATACRQVTPKSKKQHVRPGRNPTSSPDQVSISQGRKFAAQRATPASDDIPCSLCSLCNPVQPLASTRAALASHHLGLGPPRAFYRPASGGSVHTYRVSACTGLSAGSLRNHLLAPARAAAAALALPGFVLGFRNPPFRFRAPPAGVAAGPAAR